MHFAITYDDHKCHRKIMSS